jgi:acetylornithine deacetylase/succinyl-diaminopimelate desuccinylase-like protein
MYSITATSAQNGDVYKAIFNNALGTTVTTSATLTVTGGAGTSAPVVTSNPVSQSVTAGSSVTFSAAATGNPSPTDQWQVSTDGGNTFTAIPGATSASYTFTATAGQTGEEFQAVFTNTQGSTPSTAATLTVATSTGLSAPTITSNPANQTAAPGSVVTFTAAATGNPAPIVLWQVSTDGGQTFSNIPGTTSPTYSFTVSASQGGNLYRAIFNNSQGTVLTTSAALTVSGSAGPSAPTVTTNPTNQTATPGSLVTFTAAASANPTPIVLWQVSTDGGQTFNNIPGSTSPSYSFAANASQTGHLYRAIFNNTLGTVLTTAAVLTVTAGTGVSAPTITTNPTDQTASAGSTVTFAAAAAGAPTPIVLWQVSADGGLTFSNIPGSTSPSYSFTATTSQNGDLYRAIFNNSQGTVLTSAALLTVTA